MRIVGIVSAALTLGFGVYAVMERSILRSAVGLALASASLSVLLYDMGGALASVFELSVCTGLVTVIFISGISLSQLPKMEVRREYRDRERNRFLPLLLIGIGGVLVLAALLLGLEEPAFAPDACASVREVLWDARQADVWGQIAAILCGGVAVAVLFRERG